jgi:translation initiation factor 2B subunit (eIF-2B alpha/beta/delta family)
MAERFDKILTDLKNNRESGATSLALVTLSALKDYLDEQPVHSAEKIRTLCDDLTAARPSMIALGNALQRWQRRIEVAEIDFKQQYLKQLVAVYQQLADASEQVAAHAANLLKPGMTVLTHSRSSQVMALFEQALEQHQDFKVIITISAPGNEGLLVASQLNRLGIPVTLITDAEMGLVMPEVDINLSGCDSWLTDHHFVNKTGTLLQALAAQHFGKPFWVLADSFKNSHQTSDEVTLEAMPTDELPLPEGDRIASKNVYFETISTRLVTGRVDEHGLQVLQP